MFDKKKIIVVVVIFILFLSIFLILNNLKWDKTEDYESKDYWVSFDHLEISWQKQLDLISECEEEYLDFWRPEVHACLKQNRYELSVHKAIETEDKKYIETIDEELKKFAEHTGTEYVSPANEQYYFGLAVKHQDKSYCENISVMWLKQSCEAAIVSEDEVDWLIQEILQDETKDSNHCNTFYFTEDREKCRDQFFYKYWLEQKKDFFCDVINDEKLKESCLNKIKN